MGLMQRNKGKRFERAIADELRTTFSQWPRLSVRRASQADRAVNSDVFVAGHPLLERLWLELTDAVAPDPRAKLFQAERDVVAADVAERWPVVVWHRMREREVHATMRYVTLTMISTWDTSAQTTIAGHAAIVTLAWPALLAMIDASCPGPR